MASRFLKIITDTREANKKYKLPHIATNFDYYCVNLKRMRIKVNKEASSGMR